LPTALSKLEKQQPLTDGRRERTRSSRAKITSAIMELIEAGEPTPSAAQIAQVAGVGLRTVFRLFDDKDTLFKEITSIIEAKVFPLIAVPLKGENWKERLFAIAERRAVIFEMIMPYRISASVRRFKSEYLMKSYHQMVGLERTLVEAILPPHVLDDPLRAKSLHLVLSFHSWRLLRQDEKLSAKKSHAVVVQMLNDILRHIPD
jgi:AcrR family transcriptional regulator